MNSVKYITICLKCTSKLVTYYGQLSFHITIIFDFFEFSEVKCVTTIFFYPVKIGFPTTVKNYFNTVLRNLLILISDLVKSWKVKMPSTSSVHERIYRKIYNFKRKIKQSWNAKRVFPVRCFSSPMNISKTSKVSVKREHVE